MRATPHCPLLSLEKTLNVKLLYIRSRIFWGIEPKKPYYSTYLLLQKSKKIFESFSPTLPRPQNFGDGEKLELGPCSSTLIYSDIKCINFLSRDSDSAMHFM